MMLRMKFELNVNGVIDEIANWGYVDTTATWEILQLQEALVEGELFDMNEESGCDQKDIGDLGKVMQKTSHKGTFELFHDNVSAKDKIVEDDSNLEVHQGIEKIPILYCKLCDKKGKAYTVQTTMDKFFTN